MEILQSIRHMSDSELAILICLIADQHCIIESELDSIAKVRDELVSIVENLFNLSCSVVECSSHTTLEDFRQAIITSHPRSGARTPSTSTYPSSRAKQQPSSTPSGSDPRNGETNDRIVNVIIAKDLDTASEEVQIQILELIRTRQLVIPNTVFSAPKRFLVIALLSGDCLGPRLNSHLNDFFFVSHHHSSEDISPSSAASSVGRDNGSDSSSVVRKSFLRNTEQPKREMNISDEVISELIKQSQAVTMSIELRRYLQDLVVFLRWHRAVAGGVSPRATRQFEQLSKCLAPLHGLTCVTPSLVALAAKKIYPHRINITTPKDERSMQWGSNLGAVTKMLQGLTPEIVIEDVLRSVEVPL